MEAHNSMIAFWGYWKQTAIGSVFNQKIIIFLRLSHGSLFSRVHVLPVKRGERESVARLIQG